MEFREARARLLEHLRHEIADERVLAAMARVPRELFVPPVSRHLAYEDMPLPIDQGQTISQPFIVALMTEALELRGPETVLELGTGSGYQTAVLAELARRVVSVERLASLVDSAQRVLGQLGYPNIEIHLAEKTLGWPQGASYDAILVTAGAPRVPPALVDQLAEGGRLVIPVGTLQEQELLKVRRHHGQLQFQDLGPCRFVPLVGEGAWTEREVSGWP